MTSEPWALFNNRHLTRDEVEALTGQEHPLEFLNEPLWDCPGCAGGDKWPITESVWRCPACDTEYHDNGGDE